MNRCELLLVAVTASLLAVAGCAGSSTANQPLREIPGYTIKDGIYVADPNYVSPRTAPRTVPDTLPAPSDFVVDVQITEKHCLVSPAVTSPIEGSQVTSVPRPSRDAISS